MSDKKMTRREALEFAIEVIPTMIEWETKEEIEKCDEAMSVFRNMIAQIDKQTARPKGKTSARIQNETFAKQFITVLRQANKPVNATWIAEHVRGVMTSQRGVHVAKIAEEWGAVERVTIKKRTYYQIVPEWHPNSDMLR